MRSSRRSNETVLVLLVLTALAGCSYPARLPPLEPAPRSTAEEPAPVDGDSGVVPAPSLADQVVELALAKIGSPYEWGGTDANGFDCSGLIQFAYGEHGIWLPRVSRDQVRSGSPVGLALELLMPGDVLGFSRGVQGETSHVGLFVGDDRFIHSSTTGVRVSNLTDPYWQARLVVARRIVE